MFELSTCLEALLFKNWYSIHHVCSFIGFIIFTNESTYLEQSPINIYSVRGLDTIRKRRFSR